MWSQEKYDVLQICFDRWSHQSGNQRGFTICKRHSQCRKWVFVKDFESRDECVTFLLTWRINGVDFDSAEQHISSTPSMGDRLAVYMEQFGT